MTHDIIPFIRKAFAFILGFFNAALFYFIPIWQLVEALFILFIISYMVGVIYSVRCQQEDVSKTKTFTAIKEFTLYALLIAGFFVIGERMHANEMMIRIIEVITWGLIYIYTTNIFKNLTRLVPYAKGLKWIYFVLNLEFIKHVPALGEYLKKEEEKHEKNS